MNHFEERLESLAEKKIITLSEAFALNKKLASYSSAQQNLWLDKVESGQLSAFELLEQLDHSNSHQRSGDEDFQQFTRRVKEFGKEVGAEIENLVNDFDKDRFKRNLQSLFSDLSETFKGKPSEQDRTIQGDYKEDQIRVLDHLNIQGNARFGSLYVDGSLTVEGELEADSIKGNGKILIKGNLRCKTLNFSGEMMLQKDLQAGSLENQGRIYLKGDYSGVDLMNRGTFNCQNDIQLIRLENSGSLSADRSLRADKIESTGILNCLGMLRAGFIDIQEGRVILMEGEQIRLGKGCRVEDLAYKDSCDIEEGARISRKKQIL